MRVLVVEPNEGQAASLALGLRREGYAVDVVHDGVRGFRQARANPYDVVISAWDLPSLDGLGITRALREAQRDMEIVLIGPDADPHHQIEGLDAGADDVVSQPLHWNALLARVRARARRRFRNAQPVLRIADLTYDPATRIAAVRGKRLVLTPRELALLAHLMRRKGAPAHREELEDAIYDAYHLPEGNAIPTIVCRVRAKLEPLEGAPAIVTLRGHGYLLEPATCGV